MQFLLAPFFQTCTELCYTIYGCFTSRKNTCISFFFYYRRKALNSRQNGLLNFQHHTPIIMNRRRLIESSTSTSFYGFKNFPELKKIVLHLSLDDVWKVFAENIVCSALNWCVYDLYMVKKRVNALS